MKTVQVFAMERGFRVFKEGTGNLAERALKVLKRKKSVVEIYLIGDEQMRFLNKKFRGKDKSIDVLSFKEPKNFPHPEDQLHHLGEIYLNLTNDKKPTTNVSRQLSVVNCQL